MSDYFDYWQFTNEINNDTCKRIINLGKDNWQKGTIQDEKRFKNNRKADVFFTDEKWLYDILFHYLHNAIQNSDWNFQIDAAESIQLTKYDVNGHQDFHYDGNGYTRHNTPDNKFIHNKTRKLSMTIILNNDYEGGEFEFFNNNNKIKEKAGTILVFPSYMVHKVNPITKGTRYSLVAWFVGEPFK